MCVLDVIQSRLKQIDSSKLMINCSKLIVKFLWAVKTLGEFIFFHRWNSKMVMWITKWAADLPHLNRIDSSGEQSSSYPSLVERRAVLVSWTPRTRATALFHTWKTKKRVTSINHQKTEAFSQRLCSRWTKLRPTWRNDEVDLLLTGFYLTAARSNQHHWELHFAARTKTSQWQSCHTDSMDVSCR